MQTGMPRTTWKVDKFDKKCRTFDKFDKGLSNTKNARHESFRRQITTFDSIYKKDFFLYYIASFSFFSC